jgi:hypothetical protein
MVNPFVLYLPLILGRVVFGTAPRKGTALRDALSGVFFVFTTKQPSVIAMISSTFRRCKPGSISNNLRPAPAADQDDCALPGKQLKIQPGPS